MLSHDVALPIENSDFESNADDLPYGYAGWEICRVLLGLGPNPSLQSDLSNAFYRDHQCRCAKARALGGLFTDF